MEARFLLITTATIDKWERTAGCDGEIWSGNSPNLGATRSSGQNLTGSDTHLSSHWRETDKPQRAFRFSVYWSSEQTFPQAGRSPERVQRTSEDFETGMFTQAPDSRIPRLNARCRVPYTGRCFESLRSAVEQCHEIENFCDLGTGIAAGQPVSLVTASSGSYRNFGESCAPQGAGAALMKKCGNSRPWTDW